MRQNAGENINGMGKRQLRVAESGKASLWGGHLSKELNNEKAAMRRPEEQHFKQRNSSDSGCEGPSVEHLEHVQCDRDMAGKGQMERYAGAIPAAYKCHIQQGLTGRS